MFESKINRGRANGYAPLDGSGKVPLDKLPPIQSTIDTGSLVTNGQTGSFIRNEQTASFATTSSLQTLIDVTGSFATTSSLQTLIDVTGSFATTGSNQFYGDQSISGSVNISSSLVVSSTFVNNGTIGALNSDLIIDGGNIILSGSMYFGSGSSITETSSSIIITPAGAAAGQSLVVRQTGIANLYSDHPSGFYSGDTITLTFSPNNNYLVTGSAPYIFTGCTQEQLGTSLSGSLIYNDEYTKTLTWTIPALSDISGFTFEIYNFVFFVSASISLSSSGSSEQSHIHLVSGDPSLVDIYLGDDDQYVKVEKNAGDVVIGTNLDTHHWRFDTSGSLTTSGDINVSGSIYADNLVGVVSSSAQITEFGFVSSSVTIPDGTISGSAQITEFGFVTSSRTIDTDSFATTGSNTFTGTTSFATVGGDEGGEIQFGIPATNTTLQNRVTTDVFQNRYRIFEGSSNAKGVYIDLSKAPNGVGGEITWKASGIVNRGVDVTLGNLKARLAATGNEALQLSTVSGTYNIYGSGTYNQSGTISGVTLSSTLLITTTPTYVVAGYDFGVAGAVDVWNIVDVGSGIAWRITMMIGFSFLNNFISIERLN